MSPLLWVMIGTFVSGICAACFVDAIIEDRKAWGVFFVFVGFALAVCVDVVARSLHCA